MRGETENDVPRKVVELSYLQVFKMEMEMWH